ncbi:MAG: L-serine ammonia-lyase [Alphaproteobacteria bacterium]|jgi:L-serine dehydratase|nr:L-serine ammonia-lyase [Alphaproteobacteria bacterium]
MQANSVLSIFKIGIGPSSSHTLGPMVIGKLFCESLNQQNLIDKITNIRVDLYGSLSLTGKGHLTDVAVILGLSGKLPETTSTQGIKDIIESVSVNKSLLLDGVKSIPFNQDQDIVFNPNFLDLHENGITISAYAGENLALQKTYFSTGGGFVKEESNFYEKESTAKALEIDFKSAQELLDLCNKYNKSISEIALMREMQFFSKKAIYDYYKEIWEVMDCCIDNGLNATELLPGDLHMQRRANNLYKKLTNQENDSVKDDFNSINWLSVFALAVAEENASGHRVVTAPTNGACAVVPAVMAYYNKFYKLMNDDDVVKFLLTASAIGYLYKTNASLSGAEAGCQAEIGVASSMAAAAVAEMLGANPKTTCDAAEIAMEHHLGLTCDPVGGLVQIPCIERNTFGAVKAVMSAKMAIDRGVETSPMVSLDEVITTMFHTGKDIDHKYRETSQGGLAKVLKLKLLKNRLLKKFKPKQINQCS